MKTDKEGHYIMINGSIQEDITIINISAPNREAPQYWKQMLTSMKREINSNTIIVGDFNTPLTPMDRSTKQKISKETQTLNDTMDQLDLIDIYRTFGSSRSIVSVKVCVSFLTFCLVDLSIGVSGVLKSPTIIVLLLISPFILVSICITYCGASMLGGGRKKKVFPLGLKKWVFPKPVLFWNNELGWCGKRLCHLLTLTVRLWYF